LILAAAALRLVVAACLEPGNDEAYHYLFAVHPDWSYFDHPPMLALVESAGLALVGFHASVFALRLGIVALFAGSTWLMAHLTARHYGPAAGVLAAFALSTTAYYGVAAATLALPDGPLVFFWLLTLERLLVALEEPKRVGAWAAAGLAWGGAMLSKYQAVFLPVATLIYLVLEPAARHWLRRPGPYLAFGLGLLVFAPVVAWNVDHGWASFAFQAGRALGGSVISPARLVAFLGEQAAYLFPWLWVFLMAVLLREARGLFGRGTDDLASRFLLYQAVLPLLVFAGVALVRPVLPHWSLVGFLATFPLLGRSWARRMAAAPGRLGVRLCFLGIVTVALTGLVVTQAQTGFLQRGGRHGVGLIPVASDPTVEFYGWGRVRHALEARGLLDRPALFLFTDRWYHSGHLAFATDRRIAVACYNRQHAQNFAYWSDPREWVGRDGIFVGVNECEAVVGDLSRWFRRFEPLGAIPVVRNGVCIRVVHLYRGVQQTAPFPFGNSRVTPRLRGGAASRGTPRFDWMPGEPLDKIRKAPPPLIEGRYGAEQPLQGMKQTMRKHQKSFRHCSLCVDVLEERLLLSGGSFGTKGVALAAVAVAHQARASDFSESDDGPSGASRPDTDLTEDENVVSVRAAATTGTSARAASDPGLSAGSVIGIRSGPDAGTVFASGFDSVSAGTPMASAAAVAVHPAAPSVAGSPGVDRPASLVSRDASAAKWPGPDLPPASEKGASGSAASGPAAAAPGVEPIAPPRGFGLITEAFPFVRASLEQAVDRFLTRIEEIRPGSARWHGSARPLTLLELLLFAAAARAVARKCRREADREERACELGTGQRIGRHGLPGLPSPR
jgi:hypothetical protein